MKAFIILVLNIITLSTFAQNDTFEDLAKDLATQALYEQFYSQGDNNLYFEEEMQVSVVDAENTSVYAKLVVRSAHTGKKTFMACQVGISTVSEPVVTSLVCNDLPR